MKTYKINEEYTCKIGENAKENWKLLGKSNKSNYFLHLSSFPSCYVILEGGELKPTLNIIKEAAKICKNNTKYRNLQNLKVDYCLCSNVRKGKKIGEAVFVSNRKVKQIKV